MLDLPDHEYELYSAFLSGLAAKEISWTAVPKEEFIILPQNERKRLVHELKDLLRTPM